MNRRQAAQVDRWAADDAAWRATCERVRVEAENLCLLCSAPCQVYEGEDGLFSNEVCAACNAAFQGLADRLHQAQVRRQAAELGRTEARELAEHVEGQLELTAEEAEEVDGRTELDGRSVRLAGSTRELTADEWDVIFSALAHQDFTGVPTALVADALREGEWTEGLHQGELAELRAILARRS